MAGLICVLLPLYEYRGVAGAVGQCANGPVCTVVCIYVKVKAGHQVSSWEHLFPPPQSWEYRIRTQDVMLAERALLSTKLYPSCSLLIVSRATQMNT